MASKQVSEEGKYSKPPKRIEFVALTPEYLEEEEKEEEPLSIAETDDVKFQMHDILEKWKTDDGPPSNAISEPKVELLPNPKFESGSKLPNRVKIDDSLLGVPLEDIDPFYRKSRSTFIVIGRDRNLTRFSAHKALYTLSPFSRVRKSALYVLVHPIFSLLVILTILCNCVFMAMRSPPEIAEYVFTSVYTLEALIKILARGFVLKPFTYLRDAWNILDFIVISLAYITSFVNLGNFGILRTFRVLRALKTVAIVPGLKTIVGALLEAVRRLRDVAVLTLFMLSIFALIGLQLYMGELGNKCVLKPPSLIRNESNSSNATDTKLGVTQSYHSSHLMTVLPRELIAESSDIAMLLHRKRRGWGIGFIDPNISSVANGKDSLAGVLVTLTSDSIKEESAESSETKTGILWSPFGTSYDKGHEAHDGGEGFEGESHHNTETFKFTAEDELWVDNETHWLPDEDGGYVTCAEGGCPENYICVPHIGGNPDYGFTNFDHYGWAMFSGFRLMTQDCWERLFHQVISATGTYHVVYFMMVIFLGSFYLINLILAIVAMSYQDLQNQEEAAVAEEKENEEAERRAAAEEAEAAHNLEVTIETPEPHISITRRRLTCESGPSSPCSQHLLQVTRHASLARRNDLYDKPRSVDLPIVVTPLGSAKVQRRRTIDRPCLLRRSSFTGHDRSHDRKMSSSRQSSATGSPSVSSKSRPRKLPLRISLPYLDDSQAITPTSEMLYNCDFHIADYLLALQKLTAGSQVDVTAADTTGAAGVPPSTLHADGSIDSRSTEALHHSTEQTNAQLAPWRLAALHRGSASIDDEGLVSGPPEVIMERLRTQIRHTKKGKLERRPAIDDASSIFAVDVFSATPQRHQQFAIPMVDDSMASRVSDSTAVSPSRLSIPSEQWQLDFSPRITAARGSRSRSTDYYIPMQDIIVTSKDGEERESELYQDSEESDEPPVVTAVRKCWNSKAHKIIEVIANDPFFDLLITCCIVVNTAFMALDHHGMSQTFEDKLRHGNYFFTAIFATEAGLKIIALSPCRYFTDSWNIFDSFIVFLSLVELGLEGVQGLSVLRTFRLLRVFKLARSWPTLNLLIGIIGRTLGALGNLTFVLGIIVFIFAVMGMQLFGQSYRENKNLFPQGELPRWHFEDFIHSFMIVFRVLCGEWVESSWDCLVVFGWPCVPFFVLTLVVGNLVVLNLFLALLLDSFSSENIQSIVEEKANEPNKMAEAMDRFSRLGQFLKKKLAKLLHIRLRDKRLDAKSLEQSIGMMAHIRKDLVINKHERRNVVIDEAITIHCDQTIGEVLDDELDATPPAQSQTMPRVSTLPSIRRNVSITPHLARLQAISANAQVDDCCPKCCYRQFKFINECMEKPAGVAFARLRRMTTRFMEHKYTETVIIILIVISSLALAIEDVNTRQNEDVVEILGILDKCFSVIFAIEMILKWIALGFRRYFSDGWCWLDFIIVSVSIISWVAEGAGLGNLGAFRALRTLRALRPLRAVSRWEGMKIVVNALLQAIPSICNVFLVCVVFWLIFSIMGVQLFAGRFHRCVDEDDVRLPVDIVANRTECLAKNYTWANAKINFDHVGKAYLSLLQVATFSGWIEIMADAVDTVDLDQQPYREASQYFYFYFVLFIIFGSFFTLNLFIGVIIENFNKQKKRSGGSIEMFMTDEQKKYYSAMKKLKNKGPQKPIPKPKNPYHAKLFSIVTNQRFEVFIMIIIMLNMLQMCLEYHNQPQDYTDILSYINIFFVAIFTGEMIAKMIALRQYYFTQAWNIFDCAVVILSIIASSLADYMADFPVSPTILRVVRVFRVGRVLRLVKSAKGIRTLLFSLAVSLPALFNIGLLLLLIIFIYGCFGMSFFMNVRLTEGLNEHFNFRTIINSILLLFQLATSAGWDTVLLALLNDSPPSCDPTPTKFSPTGDCSNSTVAIIYLVSYIIISFMIVINMYIAVILENFGEATQDIQQGLTQDDFDAFFEKWERFDPKATQYIGVTELSNFVASLEPPLSIQLPNWRSLVILDPPICTDLRIHCDDIVIMLVRNTVAGSVSNAAEAPELNLDCLLTKEKPDYEVIASLSQLDMAARRIQRRWRLRRRLHTRRKAIDVNMFSISSDQPSSSAAAIEPCVQQDGDDVIISIEVAGNEVIAPVSNA